MGKFLTKKLYLIAAGILILAAAVYFLAPSQDSNLLLYQTEKLQLSIKDTYLSVDVSDTAQKHQRGLSNRPSLANGEGMLFIYDPPTRPSFWMKDMKFSIDIIWIGEDKKIVFVHESVSPDTFPRTFAPPRSIKYVLEVNAGFARSIQAAPGDSVNF